MASYFSIQQRRLNTAILLYRDPSAIKALMKKHHFNDLPCMPDSGLTPGQLLAGSQALVHSAGQSYVEYRGIPLQLAAAAGVRFAENFGGRPAVIIGLYDDNDRLTSVHGRYINTLRGQNKMLTIGTGNGMISVLNGLPTEPLIVVEGLFDALSLALCGWSCVAHIGRWASWLPSVAEGREVWLAFDASKPAERDVIRYTEYLKGAKIRRVLPPPQCKDWNTALKKRGTGALQRWLQHHLTEKGYA